MLREAAAATAAVASTSHSSVWAVEPHARTPTASDFQTASIIDNLAALFSNCCGLSPDSVNASFMSASVLPAVVTLCIVQVPALSTRLRRRPLALLSLMLLLLAVTVSKLTAPAASSSQLQHTLVDVASLHTYEAFTAQTAAAAMSQSYNWQPPAARAESLQQQHASHTTAVQDSQNRGLTVAVVPLILALLLVQVPVAAAAAAVGVPAQRQDDISIRPGRLPRSVLVAALAVGVLMMQVAAVDAAASMCAAVKPMCSAPPPATVIVSNINSASPSAAVTPKPSAAVPPKPPAAVPPKLTRPAVSTPYNTNTAYTDALLAAMGVRKEALHVASTPEGPSGTDIPQKVVPITPQSRLSKALEQQLFAQLIVALTQGAAMNSSSSTAGAVPQRRSSPAPVVAPGSLVSPNPTPPGPDANGMLYLSNARLRVGLDTSKGGCISHLSSALMPPEWANVNLINTWDSGRLVQQSYYGCEDGSCWSNRAWRWNPVQGGSWHNQPPKLLASSTFGDVVSTSAVPRNWGAQTLLEDVVMTTQARLLPNMVKIRFTMRYTGTAAHPPRHQEVPAVFVDRRLNALATYIGPRPWTGGQLSFLMPGQTNEYYKPAEKWAAYVDTKSGFGVGVYTPVAEELVAYRVGPENSTAKSDCSYFAPIVTTAIEPNTEFSYDTYIAVGRVDELRQMFAAVAATVQLDTLSVQRRIGSTRSASNARYPSSATTVQGNGKTLTAVAAERHGNDSLSAGRDVSTVEFTPSLPVGNERRLVVDTTLKSQGRGSHSDVDQAGKGLVVRPVVPGLPAVFGPLPELLAPMVIQPTGP